MTYLGDSVYAMFDGGYIMLSTNNGMGPENIIYLEDQVVQSLIKFIEKSYNITLEVKKNE